MSQLSRPLPVPSPESKPFWEGCRNERFLLQYCASCETINWFPRAFCLSCGSADFDWREAAGTATLETYSIVYRAMNDAWKDQVPYTLAWVRLTEGPRMVTRLIHPPGRVPQIDGELIVRFETLNDKFKLPFFEERPRDGDATS